MSRPSLSMMMPRVQTVSSVYAMMPILFFYCSRGTLSTRVGPHPHAWLKAAPARCGSTCFARSPRPQALSMMMPRVQTVSSVYAMMPSSFLLLAGNALDSRGPPTRGSRLPPLAAARLGRRGRSRLQPRAVVDHRLEIVAANVERAAACASPILRNRQQRRFLADALEIGAGESLGPRRDRLEVDVFCKRHLTAAQTQNRRAIGCAGFGEAHDIVEPPAAQERRLDPFGPAGGGQKNHAFDVAQAVDLARQVTQNPLVDVRARARLLIGADLWRDRVDRIEEQQARRRSARLLEDFAKRLLRLAEPFRVQLRAVDADERQLLLTRQRARDRGLPGARRSDEQDAVRRREAERPVKIVEIVEIVADVRVLDDRLEQLLHVVKSADRCERRGAALDEELARRARLDFLQAREKIVARDDQRMDVSLRVDRSRREEAPQRDHADFLAERFQVRADEAVRVVRDLLQIDVGPHRHGARVNLQDLQPRLRVRHADLDLAIEPARAAQRRIEHLGNVRRADDDDLPARDEAVHQAQELRDDALLDLADDFGPLRRDGVDLVDEENGRRAARRFLEHLAELRLALPVE